MTNNIKNIPNKKAIRISILIIIGILIFCFIMKNFFPAEWSFITPHKQGDFVRVGNMHSYCNNASSVLLDDNRVFIYSARKIEIYNPKTRRFKKIKTGRVKINAYAKLVKLKNGLIFLVGGVDSQNNISNKTFIFNPQNNTIYNGPDMLIGRVKHNAILTNEGQVLIVGGTNEPHNKISLNATEFYNPKTNKFEFGPKMPERLCDVVLINNGRAIYIYGGTKKSKNNDGSILYNNNVYIVENNCIKLIGSAVSSGFGMQACNVEPCKILLYDGYNSVNKKSTVELYDTNTDASKVLKDDLKIHSWVNPLCLPDGKLLFVGGTSGFGLSYKEHNDVYIFNYKTKQLVKTNNNLVFSRSNAKTIVLQDGNILVFSGRVLKFLGLLKVYPAEIYMLNNEIKK